MALSLSSKVILPCQFLQGINLKGNPMEKSFTTMEPSFSHHIVTRSNDTHEIGDSFRQPTVFNDPNIAHVSTIKERFYCIGQKTTEICRDF